ncbi:MAG: protein kinase [Symploca sp. SIO1A3]|nr:protein kinase [Symploca sp. SIO1A3]
MIWQAGKKLHQGQYIIIGEPLGRGCHGITYKAQHVALKETVVIKTPIDYQQIDLLEKKQYSEYVDHFFKEGEKLAKLSPNSHPNIVRVRHVFKEGTIPCLVMDFVPGKNLFEVVKQTGRLSEAIAVGYICQICDALATMHKMGLVHRDAHPGNIIVREDSRAILIDFSIAKELVATAQTITGKDGHRIFAPYEQLFSKGSRKPNVDVYCLAATLYYTVTGTPPTPSIDRKIRKIDGDDAPLIPPQQLVTDISQHLNQAILKGMELEAKNRPQSMEEWLEILRKPKSFEQVLEIQPDNLQVQNNLKDSDDELEESKAKQYQPKVLLLLQVLLTLVLLIGVVGVSSLISSRIPRVCNILNNCATEREYQKLYERAVSDAEDVLKSSNNSQSIENLQNTRNILKKLINDLKEIPTSSNIYRKAQEKLTEYNDKVRGITQQIDSLDSLHLKEAAKLAAETARQTEQPNSTEKLEKVKKLWEQALNELQAISSNSLLTQEADTLKEEYNKELAKITLQIDEERSAQAKLAADEARLAQAKLTAEAARQTEQPNSTEKLEEAKNLWEQALNELKTISSDSLLIQEADTLSGCFNLSGK